MLRRRLSGFNVCTIMGLQGRPGRCQGCHVIFWSINSRLQLISSSPQFWPFSTSMSREKAVPLFTYQPLAQQHEIRVLQIAPSSTKDAEVFAAFQVESLAPNASARFDALSYMWGDQTNRAYISIDGAPFSISQHLCSTLRALRDPVQPRQLWVDAICINQTDIDERNQQVQLMRTIYQRASAVLVWLNRDLDVSHPAFQKLSGLIETSTIADLGDDPDFWDPLREVFEDPYWKRVWIQQEISNASVLQLFCREAELPVRSVYHLLRLCNEIQVGGVLSQAWLDWGVKKPSVTLPSRFGVVNSHLLPAQGTTLRETPSDLLETLSHRSTLKCTDDRDRVYGIMFLAEDCDSGDVTVDYNLATPEVYTEVVKCILSKYRSTRFLLYSTLDYGSTAVIDKTPSWTPDWRRPPTRPSMARPLSPLNEQKPATPTTTSTTLTSISNGILSLHAIKIDTILHTYHHLFTTPLLSQSLTSFITTCTTITQDLITSSPQLSLEKNPSDTTTNHPDPSTTPQWASLLHTLAALDNRSQADHPSYQETFSRGAAELVSLSRERNIDPSFNPDTYKLGLILNLPPTAASDGLRLAKVFLTLVWLVIVQGRAPFCTENGRVGMGMGGAEVGDEVWLVPGCEGPVLMRPGAGVSGEGEKKGERRVVGEVYLDGVNFWEPVGGFKGVDEVQEGERIGGFEVEVLELW